MKEDKSDKIYTEADVKALCYEAAKAMSLIRYDGSWTVDEFLDWWNEHKNKKCLKESL